MLSSCGWKPRLNYEPEVVQQGSGERPRGKPPAPDITGEERRVARYNTAKLHRKLEGFFRTDSYLPQLPWAFIVPVL